MNPSEKFFGAECESTAQLTIPITRYFVERLAAHSDSWMIRFDDEESGPYKSQSEAVHFALDAAEERSLHGGKGQVVIISPTWTHDQDISRGSW